MADDVDFYDIPPAFQNRLLRWMQKTGSCFEIRARDGKFHVDEVEANNVATGERVNKSLELALNDVMKSRATELHVSGAFQRRVRKWLEGNDGRISLRAAGDEFRLTLVVPGAEVEAVDEDIEVALAIAEGELEVQAVVPGSAAPTVAGPTIRDIEPMTIPAETRPAETREAPTRVATPLFGGDERTLRESGLAPNSRWSRAYINSLPDSAFLYVEPGGRKDRIGRSHPLSLRHLPYKNRNGRIDQAHLKAALSRSMQEKTDLPERVKEQVFRRAHEIYEREFGHVAAANPPPRLGTRAARATLHGRELPSPRELIEREEARERREERPFDPELRYERETKSHHFAVNHGRRRYKDKDMLREVMLGESGYVLLLWDTRDTDQRGQSILGYAFYEPGMEEPLFEGEDFGASPMHAIDSDDTLRALINFLTLKPGDTDRDYFRAYTEEQMAFAEGDAESLQEFGFEPGAFGEGYEPPPLIDVA